MSIPNKMKFIPDIVNLCIDEIKNGEITGRLFHCYHEGPIQFGTFVQAMGKMEELYDAIRYPQASVRTRHFIEGREIPYKDREGQVCSGEEVLTQKGGKATFYIAVTTRRAATWQGEVYWADKDVLEQFSSDIELLALIDGALK